MSPAAGSPVSPDRRGRWHLATGQRLPPPPQDIDIWPKDLAPQFRDVAVAIARTEPAFDREEGVREVEALALAAIAAARRAIYVENQYFAAHRCRATPGNQPQATSGTHPLGIAFHPDWVNTTKV